MAPSPRILVTRAARQSSTLADRLRALGAEPVVIPAIEIAPPTSWQALEDALATLHDFDWIAFTSANAVEAFADRLHSRPVAATGVLPRIASIGPATTRALEAAGMPPYLTAATAVAESLADALLPHVEAGTRVLLPRAEVARDVLPDMLRSAGAEVAIASVYRNVIPAGSVEALQRLFAENPPDAITFTSSSTATNLFALLAEAGLLLPQAIVRASIGPITSATLRDAGYPPNVESPQATTQALAEALMQYLQQSSGS